MTSKILGAAIILGMALGIVFLVKFMPAYFDADKLHDSFKMCISNFAQWGMDGCQGKIKGTLDNSVLDLDVADIYIDIAKHRESVLSVEWEQEIDFWGAYTYVHTFSVEHKGKPPMR